jgi:uncharacterized membrane protein YqjE
MNETDRPVGELLRELSEQTSTLVRQELELARLELTQKGKRAGIGVGMFGGAGALGFYALGALTAAIVLVLATAMKGWLAALIVAAAYAVVAGALALMGKTQVQQATPPLPQQATHSVKEDVRWTTASAKRAKQ